MSVPTPTQTEEAVSIWSLDFEPEMKCESPHTVEYDNGACSHIAVAVQTMKCSGESKPVCALHVAWARTQSRDRILHVCGTVWQDCARIDPIGGTR
jgi:hypothetical protein